MDEAPITFRLTMHLQIACDRSEREGGFPERFKRRPILNRSRKAAQVGPAYAVRYGQNRIGTLGFMVLQRSDAVQPELSQTPEN